MSAWCTGNHQKDDNWTLLGFWTFCPGLSLESVWTAWNGLQRQLDWISAAICVCGQVASQPWTNVNFGFPLSEARGKDGPFIPCYASLPLEVSKGWG